MAYYFMIEKKKGQYESLDVSSLFNDEKKRKYTKPGAYTLQEIDMFTMQCEDETELRRTLLFGNVVSFDCIDKPLSIRWVSRGEYTKVPYDFLYQKDLDYVIDPSKIIDIIMERYRNEEFVFIKKFAEYFSGYYDCSVTASEVSMYTDMAIRDRILSKYLEERDKNNDKMVQRLIKLLLYEYYEYPSGYIDYKDKIKYRNLHMIIAFINNYDIKNGLVEKKECANIRDFIPKDQNKVKKRIKKKEVPGQLSFFDNLDDEDK